MTIRQFTKAFRYDNSWVKIIDFDENGDERKLYSGRVNSIPEGLRDKEVFDAMPDISYINGEYPKAVRPYVSISI